MSLDDEEYDKKYWQNLQDDTDGDAGDAGGTGTPGGAVAFREFISTTEKSRDETLPPDELRRLLAVHKDTNEKNVKKQKEKRAEIQALKDGKKTLENYRQGQAASGSEFMAHPALADKAQFSGADASVTSVPTDSNANTNDGDRHELTNEYQLTHHPEMKNQPTFNPKPTPFSRS